MHYALYLNCKFKNNLYAFVSFVTITKHYPYLDIDGGWSSWNEALSEWNGNKCNIRTRNCTNPKPCGNGQFCLGEGIDISHCPSKV